ncbi:MAG: HAMP domain-containing histidine kinase [Chloroflexia bacterium]|nr:HAMP domain-containing histidine kinase [Chloroflexia bacterium]
MRRLSAIRLLAKADLDRFLAQTISRLRWVTIAALFAIALVQPAAGRGGLPEWALVAGFAGYNLVLDLVRRRWPAKPSFAWAAVLDVPAVGLVYLLSAQPGGPLFVLVLLAAAQTTAFMTLPGGLLYSGVLGAIVALVEPTLPLWTGTPADGRALSGRLVALGVVGVGMGALTRRLEQDQEAAQSMLDETSRLEALDRLRADFVATVSHDLRTPLTAARAALVLVDASAGHALRADERELLANARRNVERLGLLIDDLLAYNQLAAGTLRLDREPLDLRAVATDAMAAVLPLLQATGQTLEIDLPAPLPSLGDAARLEQVFLNLLANAHRHTPPGTRISVSGRIAATEVHVRVADDGPGIPTGELEAIFGRFYRRDPHAGGSGLGLVIARAIVDLHGGRLWAESRPGAGASFFVALPRYEGGGEP